MYAEFDQVVKESRMEAEEALKKIPEIERHIEDAETSTRSALAELHSADMYASAAEELALAAQNKSNSALDVCDVAVCSQQS